MMLHNGHSPLWITGQPPQTVGQQQHLARGFRPALCAWQASMFSILICPDPEPFRDDVLMSEEFWPPKVLALGYRRRWRNARKATPHPYAQSPASNRNPN